MTSLLSFTPSTPSIYLPTFSNVRHHHRLSSTTLLISYPHPSHVSMSSTVRRMLPTPVPFRLRPTRRRRWPLAGRWSHRVCSRRRLRPRLCFDNLTQRNLLQQKIGAYIVWAALHAFLANFQHLNSGSLLCLCGSLVNCLRLLLHGLSIVTNEGLVKSVTREGNPNCLEVLLLCSDLILCALAFWRESPVGVVSLAMSVVGMIPYNQKKIGLVAYPCFFLVRDFHWDALLLLISGIFSIELVETVER
ncbi:vitamin E pathway gene 5, partial [Prunus dulcis]